MSSSLIMSDRDLRFLLFEWLDVESLTERSAFADHDRSTFDDILGLSATIAADHFAPHNRATDLSEPIMDGDGTVQLIPVIGKALRAYADAGLTSSTFDEALGGLQLPFVVHTAASTYFQAASAAMFAYPFLATANAHLLVAHGTPEQVRTYAQPVIDGRWYGTMCLSEPEAGSSLGDLRTRATPQPDGGYRLTGQKMWISAGDHELTENIVHLVLARIDGSPPGVKGLSLFIVPKFLIDDAGSIGERNDVALAGLNHKMGYRGATNAVLNFGEGRARPGGAAGAVGHLVGEANRGLSYMFHMMNEARISVGAAATALGCTGYLHSLDYARRRTQGRPPDMKDPNTPQVLLVDHPDVRRMLLAQKSYAEGALALVLYSALLVDQEQTLPDATDRTRAHALLEVLTPVTKSWPSQWCVAANDLAIQVHGGYGYTRDYPVEQFYRDNRLNPIHEGTHGIQALDLLGRKLVADGGRGLDLLEQTVRATIERAHGAGGRPSQLADALSDSLGRLVEVTRAIWAPGDPAAALSNATVHLEATGHLVIAWMWLEQVVVAEGRTGAFYDGKRAAAEYFYRFELPGVTTRLDLLASMDRLTLDLDPDAL